MKWQSRLMSHARAMAVADSLNTTFEGSVGSFEVTMDSVARVFNWNPPTDAIELDMAVDAALVRLYHLPIQCI